MVPTNCQLDTQINENPSLRYAFLNKLYQHRPQTVSKRFAWANVSQKRFLGTPYLPPQEQTALSMFFVGIDIANCSATREDKRRTRPGHSPATELLHGQSVCPGLVSTARGQEEDNSRTREGQEEDKTQPQSLAAESRRTASQCGQLCIPQTVYCWGSILEKKSWPHSLAAPLNSVAGLCVQALSSSSFFVWLGSVSRPCPPLVLVLAAPLNSVAGLCGPVYWRGVWPNK